MLHVMPGKAQAQDSEIAGLYQMLMLCMSAVFYLHCISVSSLRQLAR